MRPSADAEQVESIYSQIDPDQIEKSIRVVISVLLRAGAHPDEIVNHINTITPHQLEQGAELGADLADVSFS